MVLDSKGFIAYFSTRNNRAVAFAGRFYAGDVQKGDFSHVYDYGTYGYFMVHKDHFLYRKHMQMNYEYSNICLPGANFAKNNGGLKVVMPD